MSQNWCRSKGFLEAIKRSLAFRRPVLYSPLASVFGSETLSKECYRQRDCAECFYKPAVEVGHSEEDKNVTRILWCFPVNDGLYLSWIHTDVARADNQPQVLDFFFEELALENIDW